MSALRILVTGGDGVIGNALCRELVSRGHSVVSLDLRHREDEVAFSIDTPERGNPLSYVRCDVAEYRQLLRAFRNWTGFDYVYHAAAEFGRWNGEDFYEQLWRTNVIGTKNIIKLQQSERFNLIHFSSSEVYGDWPELMVETVMDRHEVKQLNDYAMTKWVNEMQVRNSEMEWETQTVVVRLFNTYGPGEYYSPYRSVNCRFLYSALKGIGWTVFGGHKRTSTFIPDTVRTLANISEKFRPGETYNIGGDKEHTIDELSDAVLEVTGASRTLVTLANPEPMTTKVKHVDTRKAIEHLGHANTVDLKTGLKLTAEWMRKVYGL